MSSDDDEDLEDDYYYSKRYYTPENAMINSDYRNMLALKENHEKHPILITPKGFLYVETFSKLYPLAYQFLIGIADPINRPMLMHVYKITKYSLYTAMVLQYHPQDILKVLSLLSKNKEIPVEVQEFITTNTRRYGSARFFLKGHNYYLDIQKNVY